MKTKKEYPETRELNLMFAKAGSGSISCRVTIPKPWADALGASPDDRSVVAVFDGEKIIISKKK